MRALPAPRTLPRRYRVLVARDVAEWQDAVMNAHQSRLPHQVRR